MKRPHLSGKLMNQLCLRAGDQLHVWLEINLHVVNPKIRRLSSLIRSRWPDELLTRIREALFTELSSALSLILNPREDRLMLRERQRVFF